VTFPDASRGTLNVMVARPCAFASAPLMGGFSFEARSSAVKTIGPELDGPVGVSSLHAGATRASAKAK
jgi:hypothetical protein